MDDFLTYNGWFDRAYRFTLADRYPTMRVALNLLYHLPIHRIVETGCMRVLNSVMEGNSTLIFAHFAARNGGEVITIDKEEESLKICKKATSKYKEYINYRHGDSIGALMHMTTKIDLLYLDSMDCPVVGDAYQSQFHQRNELITAQHALHDRSIILLDDNNFSNGGKTALAKEWLQKNDYQCILDLTQSLWVKNPLSIF